MTLSRGNQKSELYSSLWASCDELRGGMDASQYKTTCSSYSSSKYVAISVRSVPSVRLKWKEYWDALNSLQYSDGNHDAFNVWRRKQNEMLTEMAKILGFGTDIGYDEIERSCASAAFVNNAVRTQKAMNELIRGLSNSERFGAAKASDTK